MNASFLKINWFVSMASFLLAVTTAQAQSSAYFNAITSLNPAGYWPMHEVEAVAQGDIETNYGTLGPLGEGFYPDWASASGGIKRGIAGALANDSDRAVYFSFGGSPGAGTYTNVLFIPRISSLIALNPPFSVECWVYPTNQNNESIWSSSGFEGLNAGGTGAGTGQADGITLQWNGTNTGFQVYNYFNSSTLNTEGFSGSTNVPNNTPLNHWYHVVVTCDSGTNVNLYVNNVEGLYDKGVPNGLMFSVPAVGLYGPDYWSDFQVGGGRGNTRAFPGYIDEFAIYTNLLGDVGTHYNDGTSGSSGQYFHDVTNDNPVVYLRMDAPAVYTPPNVSTWPTLTNYGTTNGVAVGNGVYSPGTTPGAITNPAVNPSGVPFGGIPGFFAALSGVSSYGDAGYATAYNPVGPTPFSVTAIFRGNPSDGRMNTIVGHSDNSWNLSLTGTGHLFWRFGTNTPANVNSLGNYNDGLWHQVVAVYTPNSNPALPGTNALYVDGLLDVLSNTASVNGLLPGTNTDVFIGSDPQYTNNPLGVGRSFAGQISDVAIFTNALTAGQVQTLYSSCEVPPYITGQPVTGRAFNGGAGTFIFFGVLARGSPTLAYQWYYNTSSNYSGATQLVDNVIHYTNSTTLNMTISNLTANDSGYYFAVITNNGGSVTSILASLTVYAAPSIAQYPVPYTNPFILYAGASPTFSISASGAQPISYFWYTNGVLDAAATSASIVWPNVQPGSFTNYCIVTNIAGSATSVVWTASVIAAPSAPYPGSVLANTPSGYWRLNEGNDNGSGDNGYIVFDYAGGNNGFYTNVILGQTSYSPTTDPSDSSAEFGEFGNLPAINEYAGEIQGIDVAATNGSNGEFTVEAWANGVNSGLFPQIFGAPLATKGIYNSDDEFNLGIDSTKLHYRFYVRDAGGTVHIVGSGSMPPLDNQWHHVVGVCDETNGLLSLYYDGRLVNTTAIATNSGVYKAPEPMLIGAGTADGVNYNNQFIGNINDVAVYNHALSMAQVQAQYGSVNGGVPPYFLQKSFTATNLLEGQTLVIPSPIAAGSPVLGYYWYDVGGGTNVAAGTTNGTVLSMGLTIANVPPSWNNDTLELIVTNAYGQTNYSVQLSVYTNPPIITLQLPSPVTVVQGNSYVYSVNVDGFSPYTYQWFSGASPGSQTSILNATNPTLTVTAGTPGMTYYSVAVSNQFGGTVSGTSEFISISSTRPALTSGYDTNLLLLNPVGYWPMHEIESPAPGDIEANYGSLGLLGEGFYPDWALPPGGNTTIVRGVPGAILGDGDTAVNFTRAGSPPAGTYTNFLFVPHNSPLTTLNPPFTVECWFYPTNTVSEDIWNQCGNEGLNAGGIGNGDASLAGIRLVWENGTTTGFEIYTLNGVQSNVGFTGGTGGNPSPLNTWYHLVLTCDANTNISLYTNGVLATLDSVGGTPVNNPASYAPDYWTPITIGGGRGGTRAVAGYIDEFAVYTNVISDPLTHYQAAISGNAGAYFQAVANDNPAIYLRMDASNYLAPATSFWPTLFNYGSAGANGFYTPGTAPGVLPGPSRNASGAPFNGLSGNVPMLSGVSSFADAGYANAYNPTGPVPFSVTAMFRGNPCDDRFQNIVGHSDHSWRIAMNNNGQLQCTLGTDPNSILNTSGEYNDQNWHQVVEVYAPNSNPNLPGTNSLYVDGVLAVSTNNVTTGGILPGVNADVLIASDPQYTNNNAAGVGRQFAGQVCEVALFTNALTVGEVSALYAAALNPNQVPAYVAPEPPLSASMVSGASLSLMAGAAGTSQVGYLWQINTNGGGSAVLQTGAGNSPLSANLTVPSVPLAWNGSQLELTVTNAYGTDSVSVALSVLVPINPNATNIMAAVTNGQLYLTWPADHTGWQLQAQTNAVTIGISTNWANYNPSTGTNMVVLPINLTNGTVFYRLTY